MDRRVLSAVALLSLVLGGGAVWLFAPGTDPRGAASPAVGSSTAIRLPEPVPVSPPRTRILPAPAPVPAAAPVDLSKTYEATTLGLIEAGKAREDRFASCFEALDRIDGLPDRVPLNLVLSDGGDAGGKVDAFATGEDPSLARCLMEAVGDARFPTPGPQAITTIVLIELSPG